MYTGGATSRSPQNGDILRHGDTIRIDNNFSGSESDVTYVYEGTDFAYGSTRGVIFSDFVEREAPQFDASQIIGFDAAVAASIGDRGTVTQHNYTTNGATLAQFITDWNAGTPGNLDPTPVSGMDTLIHGNLYYTQTHPTCLLYTSPSLRDS